jgi:hypothetical protein
MKVWMKRTLQTGLFTGGLLALGTGIASADESTIDVTAPVAITDNAVAVLGTAPEDTPAEITLPALSGTVAVDLGVVTASVPVTVGGNAADVAGIDVAQPAAAPVAAAPHSTGSAVDADVPVTVCGNAAAVLGDAAGNCTPPAEPARSADDASLVDADVPVTACGNRVAVLGDAAGTCTAPANSGGPVDPATPAPGQPGAFPRVVAPAQSATPAQSVVPAAADGSTGTRTGGSGEAGIPAGRTGTAGRTGGELAYTGGSVAFPLFAGLLALALGLVLTGASRRRPGLLS